MCRLCNLEVLSQVSKFILRLNLKFSNGFQFTLHEFLWPKVVDSNSLILMVPTKRSLRY